MISTSMRDVLIDHMDGKGVEPIRVDTSGDGLRTRELLNRSASTNALLARGLISFDERTRSKTTYITDAGRKVLAKALGDWADACVRAGYDPLHLSGPPKPRSEQAFDRNTDDDGPTAIA
jgi:hypothetical protein